MHLTTELRLAFALGVILLGAVALAISALAEWLRARAIRRSAGAPPAADPLDRSATPSRRRLEHELGARTARWRAVL
jgi:hypothetical protein